MPTIIRTNEKAKKLKRFLNSLDVENKWKKKSYIDWLTGLSITKNINYKDSFHTHCSAFITAICTKLEIFIIGPPQIRTEGLANVQYDWLAAVGKEHGWVSVKSKQEAQIIANHGFLVLMCYKDNNNYKRGHIACVTPYETTLEKIDSEGIMLCHAGLNNSSKVLSNEIFKNKTCKYWCHKIK